MKLTVKDVDLKAKTIVDIQNKINETEDCADSEIKELTQQAEAAASAGDMGRYMELKQEAERAEATARFNLSHLQAQARPVTVEDVREAWEAVEDDFEKSIQTGMKKLEQLRDSFVAEYDRLLDLQDEAITTRARLARYVGIDKERLRFSGIPAKSNWPKFEGDPNMVFYLMSKKSNNRDSIKSRVIRLVYMHEN